MEGKKEEEWEVIWRNNGQLFLNLEKKTYKFTDPRNSKNSKKKKHKITPRHIIIKFLKNGNKVKILKIIQINEDTLWIEEQRLKW